MSKENHRVTVDRDYLERLEDFFEKNSGGGNNAKLSVKNVGVAQGLFLESDAIPDHAFRDVDALYVINKEGRELAFFRNMKRF